MYAGGANGRLGAATSTRAIAAMATAIGALLMECWIYKGNRRAETYLYLAAAEDFSAVPEQLLATMGPLRLVMTLTLGPERALARANVHAVMDALAQRGYYLQLPPAQMPGEGTVQ